MKREKACFEGIIARSFLNRKGPQGFRRRAHGGFKLTKEVVWPRAEAGI